MAFSRTCEKCGRAFEAKVANKRFCGDECFVTHRKEYGWHNIESRKKVRMCRQCGCEYRRVYEKNGFCTISCGSKWHAAQGTFDAWKKSNLGKRSGKEVPCDECGKLVYIVPNQYIEPHHFCDKVCKGRFDSKRFSGSGNPMFGRKLSEEALKKQKRTLLQNHGVTNAFFLSKRKTCSKAQQDILDHLSGSVPEAEFKGDKYFCSGAYQYYIDVISEPLKMIVEYNGDYWHCNPTFYSGSYYHAKKQAYAHEIWAGDAERMRVLEKKGYSTVTVWENEYGRDRCGVLERLTCLALSCSKGV